MNRLTEKNDNKIYTLKEMEWNPPLLVRSGCTIFDVLYRAIQKLGAYEDTGLMPDEISKLNAETQEEARKMLEKVAELSEEIEKAQEKTRWIPMNDSFPTKAGDYMICTRDNYLRYRKIKLSYFDPKYAWGDVENYETVIAWMPLPEPYEEGK